MELKDLRVRLPEALAKQMEKTAAAEHITLDELVVESLEHYFQVLHRPRAIPGPGGDDIRRYRQNRRRLANIAE